MKKMTSAYANKLIKQLEDDKNYWKSQERESYIYTAAINEEPVIPGYNYETVAKTLEEIDSKIRKIKHAINLANVTNTIPVGSTMMSIDEILVKMAQLNNRKSMLDLMRKQLPQTRVNYTYGAKNAVPEYQYINYDLNVVKADYEKINEEIMVMQIALDKYNQTFEFEVDLD